MFDQRFGVLVERAGERNLASEDVLVNTHRIVIIERVNSGVHFVEQDSQSPPVDGLSVTLVQDNLGGDVLRGTADCEGSSLVEDLGKSEIGKLEIAVVSDKQIFGLEISVDNILRMKVFETASDSGSIESSLFSGERLD